MTDLELAEFLGIADDARWPKVVANLAPEKRACYERMAQVVQELNDWQAGKGPRPRGVIICGEEHE